MLQMIHHVCPARSRNLPPARNSFQPISERSIRIWLTWAGLLSALARRPLEFFGVVAMPPPEPPRVKAGRNDAGVGADLLPTTARFPSEEGDAGTDTPPKRRCRSIASFEQAPGSAFWTPAGLAPISSTQRSAQGCRPSPGPPPGFRAVLAARWDSRASGRSSSITLPHTSGGERFDVGGRSAISDRS